MKITQYDGYKKYLEPFDLANLFHVNYDADLGNNYLTYNINRTMMLQNIDTTPPNYFDLYQVKQNDTWLLISYNQYGTTLLWWLICKINGIINPIEDPEVGTELKILKTEFVSKIITGIKD